MGQAMPGVAPSFNPRPRKGATKGRPHYHMVLYGFNPRPRKGATWAHRDGMRTTYVSIHAPVRERL